MITVQDSPTFEKHQNEEMDIDELKLVLANIDEILKDDDLRTIIDGVHIDDNENTEFEGKLYFVSLTTK